jgi:membrane protein implicated in regulation of membrane protease activity
MKSDLVDWAFSFFHLFLLLGVFIYAFISLFMGNTLRFGIIMFCLGVYYFLVLHKNVVKEIKRTKKKGGTDEIQE